jgi:hypothetical protein
MEALPVAEDLDVLEQGPIHFREVGGSFVAEDFDLGKCGFGNWVVPAFALPAHARQRKRLVQPFAVACRCVGGALVMMDQQPRPAQSLSGGVSGEIQVVPAAGESIETYVETPFSNRAVTTQMSDSRDSVVFAPIPGQPSSRGPRRITFSPRDARARAEPAGY